MNPALRDPILPRRQWLELHDLAECPGMLREGVTETLRALAEAFGVGKRVAPLVSKALRAAGTNKIVDLCSGSGGPAVGLARALAERGHAVEVLLTDRAPNLPAFARARQRSRGAVGGLDEPVEATAVPEALTGLRTLYNAFHHFPPSTAREMLADAYRKRQPIAVFEYAERSLWATAVCFPICLAAGLALGLALHPRSAGRLFFTYALPAIPFVFAFDGLISHLRSYSADELEALTAGLDQHGYRWRTGKIPVLRPFFSISFLIGMPANPAAETECGL
ncbi:MAG: class I SAM-dependent methyltransferase [Bryobacteraceae bacterium]